jgi:hypothetical protein
MGQMVVEFGTRVQFPPPERAIRGTQDTELPIREDGRHSLRAVRPEMKPGRGVSLPNKPRALAMLPSKSDAPFERFTDDQIPEARATVNTRTFIEQGSAIHVITLIGKFGASVPLNQGIIRK